jgi:predicted nucleic acid-binding protein
VFVVDNTVLANFAVTDRIDILEAILSNRAVIPYHVVHEFHNSRMFSGMILSIPFVQIVDSDLELFENSITSLGFSGLGKGELSCIYTVSVAELADTILTTTILQESTARNTELNFMVVSTCLLLVSNRDCFRVKMLKPFYQI